MSLVPVHVSAKGTIQSFYTSSPRETPRRDKENSWKSVSRLYFRLECQRWSDIEQSRVLAWLRVPSEVTTRRSHGLWAEYVSYADSAPPSIEPHTSGLLARLEHVQDTVRFDVAPGASLVGRSYEASLCRRSPVSSCLGLGINRISFHDDGLQLSPLPLSLILTGHASLRRLHRRD